MRLLTLAIAALLGAPVQAETSRFKRAPEHRVVSSAAWTKLLDGPTSAWRVRAIPNRTADALNGVRLVGMRPTSVGRQMGFRNGDILRAIDGIPAQPAQLERIKARARVDGGLVFSVIRRGQPKLLRLKIEGAGPDLPPLTGEVAAYEVPKARAHPRRSPPKDRARTKPWGADFKIVQRGHTTTISSALLTALRSEPMHLARQVRIVPALRDGAPYGFKLLAIRRAGVPQRLGFQNGDVVTAINGQPITTATQALTAYATLKDARTVVLSIERRGETVDLKIQAEAPKKADKR